MKIFKNLKLRGKLIGGGAFAVLIPMLIVGVISVNTASKALIESGGGMVTQDSSRSALTGMDEISMVITEVSDIVSTIAAAVEEQSSATMEIAENISQASAGIEEVNLSVSQSSMVAQEITKDINTVNQSSRQMADRSDRVSLSAEDLSRLSAKLDQMVSRFKV